MEPGGVLPLPAVDAVLHHAVQTGVRPDDGGQAAGQRLKVGQALRLALGGADKGVPCLVVPHHLGGRHHPGKHHTVHQAQIGGLLFQLGADRAVPHEQQQGPRPGRLFGQQAQQFAVVLFGGQPPHRHQDGLPFRQAQRAAEGGLVRRVDGVERFQINAGGHGVDRAADPVPVQQTGDFAGGGQDGVAPARQKFGQFFHRHMAAALAGDQVAGIVLVYGVVGVHQRAAAPPGQLPRRQEGGKLALGVDHIGAPVGQGPHPAVPGRKADPRAGVHPVSAAAAQIDHAVFFIGMAVRREGQHPDVVALGQQFPPQQRHGPDDAVHGGRPPVGGQQYFHLMHLRHGALQQKVSDLKTNQRLDFLQKKEFCRK